MASVLHIRYDTTKKLILDPIRTNFKIKELLSSKIYRIKVSENLGSNLNLKPDLQSKNPISLGSSGFILLIKEPTPVLCQIRIIPSPSNPTGFQDPINNNNLLLSMGVIQITNTSDLQSLEMASNNLGTIILIACNELIHIYSSNEVNCEPFDISADNISLSAVN